jgi:hypothetical protein
VTAVTRDLGTDDDDDQSLRGYEWWRVKKLKRSFI